MSIPRNATRMAGFFMGTYLKTVRPNVISSTANANRTLHIILNRRSLAIAQSRMSRMRHGATVNHMALITNA